MATEASFVVAIADWEGRWTRSGRQGASRKGVAEIKTSPDHRSGGQVNGREDVRRRKGNGWALEASQREVDDQDWNLGRRTTGRRQGSRVCGRKEPGRKGRKGWPEEASARGLAGVWLGNEESN